MANKKPIHAKIPTDVFDVLEQSRLTNGKIHTRAETLRDILEWWRESEHTTLPPSGAMVEVGTYVSDELNECLRKTIAENPGLKLSTIVSHAILERQRYETQLPYYISFEAITR